MRYAILCVMLLAAPPTWALHKCTTKEGKVIYTEFECEKDATKAGVVIRDSSGYGAKDTPAAKAAPAAAAAQPASSSPAAAAPSNLPPRPQMPDIEVPKILSDPNANPGSKKLAQEQYETALKKAREDYFKAEAEWQEKARGKR